MGTKNIIGLEIDDGLITKAVNDAATAAVVAALADENIAGKVVAQTLDAKVDSRGEFSNRSFATMTWLQWMVQKAIRDEARNAVTAQLDSMRPQIKAAIEKELAKKSTMNDLVARFVDSAMRSFSYIGDTSMTVSFDVKED